MSSLSEFVTAFVNPDSPRPEVSPIVCTTYPMACPTCKQVLSIELSEDILEPPRTSVLLRLDDGHEVTLDTTHYVEVDHVVNRSILVVVTRCPKRNPINPWRELWTRVLTLGPWARYPKVYEHEREYCAYCGAWAPDHEADCPFLVAELLSQDHQDRPGGKS